MSYHITILIFYKYFLSFNNDYQFIINMKESVNKNCMIQYLWYFNMLSNNNSKEKYGFGGRN